MNMINHKTFGAGEVIGKETINGFTYLNVRFEGGKEMKFGIPFSFETGMVEALGELKEEVEKAIAEKKAKLSPPALSKSSAAPALSKSSAAPAKKTSVKSVPSGPIPSAFENYLIDAGYAVETDSGNPSTVYSYLNAVESVRAEEGISWDTLKADIDDVVDKYDEGGLMSWYGAKSNKTVINALKRFAEFAVKL